MWLEFTKEQEELRAELRSYFQILIPEPTRRELERESEGGPVHTELRLKMGADGWLGVGWPTEFGGRGLGAVEQFVFSEEALRVGAPVPHMSLNTIGPTLMRFGTPAQRAAYLPRIVSGEITFAIGYTEPQGGTDLASLRTRATRTADGYVIDGSKLFTSEADFADYIWLAVRTGAPELKHRSISIVIVPTDAPGLTITPIETVGGLGTTATYYDDVRVPLDHLVGAENEGWALISNQLNQERAYIAAMSAGIFDIAEAVADWAHSTVWSGSATVADQPWAQVCLGRARALLAALRLMNWNLVSDIHSNTLSAQRASAVKVFASETVLEVHRLLMQVLGDRGYLQRDSPHALVDGLLEIGYRFGLVPTFGGGPNEVQREIVARAGLGTPRVPR